MNKSIVIVQVDTKESRDCQNCELFKGKCLEEVKSYLVNSCGFKPCELGFVYKRDNYGKQ